MSSVDTDGEIQDLITCSVCLIEFDQDDHNPKFLPCGHTLCSSCVKVIRQNRAIRCPLCRKVHTEIVLAPLPNNNYALQLARLAREKKQLESLLQQNETSRFSLLSSTENYSALKTELGKMRALRQTNLSQAIEMRKEISSYLLFVLDSVKKAEKEIAGQLEKNERFLTDLISLYEEGNTLANVRDESTGEASNVTPDMSELESLMSSCQLMRCPDDTEETIKGKMSQSVEKSHDKLKLATCEVTQLRKWKNASFVLKAQGPGSVPLFNSTIKVDWATITFSSKDLNNLLLSHLICYVVNPSAATDSPNASSGFNPASPLSVAARSDRLSTEDGDSHLISRFAESIYAGVESTESSSEDDGSSIFSGLSFRSILARATTLSSSDESSTFGVGFGSNNRRERRWTDSSSSD